MNSVAPAPAPVPEFVPSPAPAASSSTDAFEVDGLDETSQRALRELSSALKRGDPSEMLRAGERGRVTDAKGKPIYLTNSAEEDALSWAARAFAQRATSSGKGTDYTAAFDAGGEGSSARLTQNTAKAAEKALRDAIGRGDAQSMIACSGLVVKTYGAYHAEVPRLRALTWAARVLGHRTDAGCFPQQPGEPPLAKTPPPARPSARPESASASAERSAERYLLGLPQLD